MLEPKPGDLKRPRGKYSRLICLGCRDRRIRCELPSDVEIPGPGELRTVQTPCYRCKRLRIACVVRQTILGRPGHDSTLTNAVASRPIKTGDTVTRFVIELSSQAVVHTEPATTRNDTQVEESCVMPWTKLGHQTCCNGGTLLSHIPQSTETLIIIRAVDTLRRERVENEWFRHLLAYVGHASSLDLSIKALVAACAYARGLAKVTSGDCHQALALALNAVQSNITLSQGELNDEILASTALLAPFEGVMNRQGIPTRLHVEGLAAILASRRSTYPITQLARDIFDFHACDSAIMACVQGTPSPFESISQGYFSSNQMWYVDDSAQLKAIGSELFVRIPRLLGLVRSLRAQFSSQKLWDALTLSKSLLRLRNSKAEERLLQPIRVVPANDLDASARLCQSLHFTSVGHFEALAYYWHNRLCLLRLNRRLLEFSTSSDYIAAPEHNPQPILRPQTNDDEIYLLVENILMCAEYVETLPLRKHQHLYAYAMILVWGVIKDMPMALSRFQYGLEAEHLLALLSRRTSVALEARPNLSFDEMNAAADLFVGGQPKGVFAQLYGL
ncbi:hypothetical protein GQ44DRAFT_711349 [Phaeosphaeriaceae sp. PMI808]|nr:hypothetical protein GQ44DRAFT_711349 [Phaeosphaeriaceae sp. PMI808]